MNNTECRPCEECSEDKMYTAEELCAAYKSKYVDPNWTKEKEQEEIRKLMAWIKNTIFHFE